MARSGRFICEHCERNEMRVKPFVSQSALEMHIRAKHPAKAPLRPGAARPHEAPWIPPAEYAARPRSTAGQTFRRIVFILVLILAGAAGWPFLSAYLQGDPTATHE